MTLRFANRSPLRIGFLVIVALISGCHREPSATQNLVFSGTTVDLGLVDPGTGPSGLTHEFSFTVAAKDVQITKVASSCSCTTASSNDVGRTMSAGEQGSVRVTIDAQSRKGRMQASVLVESSPPSTSPIILNLTALIPSKPAMVGAFPLPLQSIQGNDVQVEFDVQFDRLLNSEPLRLDPSRSELRGFTVEKEEIIDTVVDRIGAQTEDLVNEIHRFRLKRTPINVAGSSLEKLEFAWHGSDVLTPVQFLTTNSHPLEVQPATAFIGFAPIGEKRAVSFALLNPLDPKTMPVIEPHDVHDGSNATFDRATNRVLVDFWVPETPGRFTRTWALRSSSDPALSPFNVQISGIAE